MKTALVLQHAECETPGLIEEALKSTGYSVARIRSFLGEPVPDSPGAAQKLVIMGGPMGVGDLSRLPFLRSEFRLIESALKQKTPVLGVCLGSQLLAAALGASVRQGARKEIGWHGVKIEEAQDRLLSGIDRSFEAFHWHGDVFDLPSGATKLASSELTGCQAFRYEDSAYGFLFHMEITREILEGMLRSFRSELDEEGLSADKIRAAASDYLARLQTIGKLVFDRWASLGDSEAGLPAEN